MVTDFNVASPAFVIRVVPFTFNDSTSVLPAVSTVKPVLLNGFVPPTLALPPNVRPVVVAPVTVISLILAVLTLPLVPVLISPDLTVVLPTIKVLSLPIDKPVASDVKVVTLPPVPKVKEPVAVMLPFDVTLPLESTPKLPLTKPKPESCVTDNVFSIFVVVPSRVIPAILP